MELLRTNDISKSYGAIKALKNVNLSLSENKIYEAVETPSLVNSDFQKLNLEESNFLTPEDYGSEEFKLELDGKEIFSENIQIKKIPEIKRIIPKIFPSLVSVEFLVELEDFEFPEITF